MALGLLPPVVATLVADIHQFSAEMDKAKAQMSTVGDSGSSMMNKIGAGVVLAGVGIAAASVKMASDFQTQMTRLYTAAGAPEAAVKGATDQVLALGNSVGYSGTQIAEALYHPVSAGLDLATSLQVVKYAAEEAQISGASLDDTTYGLSSVMKAFNIPATQAANTMAQLNAIVGQGDMHFQDFNASIKNWAPTAAQMGISIQSMGAALAYLTDRGNSAEEAGTRVTMGLTMMAYPTQKAASLLEGLGVASADVQASSDAMQQTLKKAGITQNQLAADLQKPDGINFALYHLKTALEQAGVSGTEADSVMSKIFGGGRSDKAILSLMQNLDGLKTKFGDIGTATDKYGQAWADTQATFAFQLKQTGAEVENLAIKFGTMLIPIVQDVAGWFSRNQWAVEALAGVIGTVLVASLVKFSITATTTVLEAIQKVIVGITGMGAAAKTTAAETEAAATASTAWTTSLGRAIPVFGLAIAGAAGLGEKLGGSGMFGLSKVGDHTALSIDQFTNSLLDAANGSQTAQDQVTKLADGMVLMSDMSGKTVQGLTQVDSSLAQLYSSGNAAAAKKEFDAITQSLSAQGLSAQDAASKFPQYAQAIQDAATQQKLMASSANNAGTAVAGTTDPLNQAATAAQGTADAVSNVTDAFTTLSAQLTRSGELDTFQKDLLSVTDEIKKNGTAFTDNTLTAIANRDAFRNAADEILKYRDDMIKNGQATDDANQVAAQQVQKLIDVWVQAGANKQQIQEYTKFLGLIPANLYTAVNVDTAPAVQQLNGLLQQINQSTGTVQVYASSGNPAGGKALAYADGGYVPGPKGSPQWAVVHGGEFVLSNAMLAAASVPAMPLGGSASPTQITIEVYVDGSKTRGAVQRQTLRYQSRNSKNGLSLTGTGG